MIVNCFPLNPCCRRIIVPTKFRPPLLNPIYSEIKAIDILSNKSTQIIQYPTLIYFARINFGLTAVKGFSLCDMKNV